MTAGLSGQKEKKEQSTPQEEKEANDAYNLMPKAIQKQLPKLYSTQKELVGDKTAYARYFFPMGAYTAYILEYDPQDPNRFWSRNDGLWLGTWKYVAR